jgi:hypothetical protein
MQTQMAQKPMLRAEVYAHAPNPQPPIMLFFFLANEKRTKKDKRRGALRLGEHKATA